MTACDEKVQKSDKEWGLVLGPWQCSQPCNLECPAVFGQTKWWLCPTAYSSDLAPCDYFVPKLLTALDSISAEDIGQCCQLWEQHWYHCILSQGGVLGRGLKIPTCTNILNKFFVTILEIFGSTLVNILKTSMYASEYLKTYLIFSCIHTCVLNIYFMPDDGP